MPKSIFITATDTGVGKTYFSKRILNELIESGSYQNSEIAYFKPVQCGEEINDKATQTDFSYIKDSVGVDVHYSYFFKNPCSPHYAALLESQEVKLEKILSDFRELEKKYKFILVEGAGGVAVPLNECELVSDLIRVLGIPAILVIRPDLGTINHSLLSLGHLIHKQGIEVLGLLVSQPNSSSDLYTINDEAFLKNQRKNSIDTICKNMNVKIFDINELKN